MIEKKHWLPHWYKKKKEKENYTKVFKQMLDTFSDRVSLYPDLGFGQTYAIKEAWEGL